MGLRPAIGLLDKSVVRRCLRGLIGGALTDDVRHSLRLLSTFAPDELYISLQTLHILTHIVKVPQARVITARTTVLYPGKYSTDSLESILGRFALRAGLNGDVSSVV